MSVDFESWALPSDALAVDADIERLQPSSDGLFSRGGSHFVSDGEVGSNFAISPVTCFNSSIQVLRFFLTSRRSASILSHSSWL